MAIRRNILKLFVTGLCVLASLPVTHAEETTFMRNGSNGKTFGIGLGVGAPFTVTGRYQMEEERAIDAQISLFAADYTLVYADYLFQFINLFSSEDKIADHITPYVGIGPLFALSSNNDHPRNDYLNKTNETFGFGFRVPIGVEWMAESYPLGVGLEVGPGVVVAPSTAGFIQIDLTVRYYF